MSSSDLVQLYREYIIPPAGARIVPKRPSSAPASGKCSRNHYSQLTPKVSYWPGCVSSEYSRNFIPVSARGQAAEGTHAIVDADLEKTSAEITKTPRFNESPELRRQEATDAPTSITSNEIKESGIAKVEIGRKLPLRRKQDCPFGGLSVKGEAMCIHKPSETKPPRRGRRGQSLKITPRGGAPPQPTRPASAPAAGRRIDPYGRGLHSQIWGAQGHYPGVLQTSQASTHINFRLHEKEWDRTREARGGYLRYRSDMNYNTIVVA
jgi:hypothetical protein